MNSSQAKLFLVHFISFKWAQSNLLYLIFEPFHEEKLLFRSNFDLSLKVSLYKAHLQVDADFKIKLTRSTQVNQKIGNFPNLS